MYNTNNIFSKILRKEIPCKAIYEDEKILFINDINPQAKIHILANLIRVLHFAKFPVFALWDAPCSEYTKHLVVYWYFWVPETQKY